MVNETKNTKNLKQQLLRLYAVTELEVIVSIFGFQNAESLDVGIKSFSSTLGVAGAQGSYSKTCRLLVFSIGFITRRSVMNAKGRSQTTRLAKVCFIPHIAYLMA